MSYPPCARPLPEFLRVGSGYARLLSNQLVEMRTAGGNEDMDESAIADPHPQ